MHKGAHALAHDKVKRGRDRLASRAAGAEPIGGGRACREPGFAVRVQVTLCRIERQRSRVVVQFEQRGEQFAARFGRHSAGLDERQHIGQIDGADGLRQPRLMAQFFGKRQRDQFGSR